jgi:rubrerythrin
MSDYTPTTEEVRKSFIYGERYKGDKVYPVRRPDAIKNIEDEFDRWFEVERLAEQQRIIALLERIEPCDCDELLPYVCNVHWRIALIRGERHE